ncbi:MAG: polysaccharide deacetylase family protein [Alishewanella agri]|nr:polysaccharide deacetylase family protein [Alishewanella agri]
MFNNVLLIDNLAQFPPMLQVVVDTEEAFDWQKFPSREQVSVNHLNLLESVQAIFRQYGIKPCYAMDYPVVKDLANNVLIREFHRNGQCEIGAQLHPWVNPPFTEQLSFSNMYPGNLDNLTEKAKLQQLTELIAANFGERPTIYKAGRYGFGENTQSILEELGYLVDLSVCPPFDHSKDGGPDYHSFSAKPFTFGKNLLEIPLTGAYVSIYPAAAHKAFRLAQKFEQCKLPGIFARSGIVDRLMLSPEGYTFAEHVKLTKFLLQQGVRLFTWSFHSSSIEPGNTSYVRSNKDLEVFLDSFKRYFDFFFNELGGQATSPHQIRMMIQNKNVPTAS